MRPATPPQTNNLETDLAASRPLYSIIRKENTQCEFSYEQSSENPTENATSDEESGLILNAQHKEQANPCCEEGSICSNILASGILLRFITKATGLWNPRKKHYALLCVIFVVLNIVSLLAEILIPSICGPFEDRCVTHSKNLAIARNFTKGTDNDSQSVAMFTKIVETALALDVWNATVLATVSLIRR